MALRKRDRPTAGSRWLTALAFLLACSRQAGVVGLWERSDQRSAGPREWLELRADGAFEGHLVHDTELVRGSYVSLDPEHFVITSVEKHQVRGTYQNETLRFEDGATFRRLHVRPTQP